MTAVKSQVGLSAKLTGLPNTTVPGYSWSVTAFSFSGQNFESGFLNGWAAGTGTTAAVQATNARTGTQCANVYRTSTSGAGVLTASIGTGSLVAGYSYTARAWVRKNTGAATVTNAFISVTGVGSGAVLASVTSTYQELTYTFTASASTHVVNVNFTTNTSGSTNGVLVDDITFTQNAATYTVADSTIPFAFPVADTVETFTGGHTGWTSGWDEGTNPTGSIEYTGNRMVMANTERYDWAWLDSPATFDFNDHGVSWRVSINDTRSLYGGVMGYVQSGTYQFRLVIQRESATSDLTYVYVNARDGFAAVGGTHLSVLYDPDQHRYFRIRESSNVIFWEVSADGRSWTVLKSYTHAIPNLTLATSYVSLNHMGGETLSPTPPYPQESYWDDITAWSHVAYMPLNVIQGDITLDSESAPYAVANVTVELPAEEYLEQIDPLDSLRLQLTAEQEWSYPTRDPASRTFDLILQRANVVAEGGVLELTAGSDEVLLIDGGHLGTSVDTSAETNQASLRGIINGVLAGYSASLQAGTADADFTITTNSTNLVTNPALNSASTNWSSTNGTGSRVASGGPVTGVSAFWRTTLTASQTTYYATYAAAGMAITAGRTYVASVWVRSSVAINVYLDFYGTNIDSPNNYVALPANTWTRINTGAVAIPSNASAVTVRILKDSGVASAIGATLDVTGLRVSEYTGVTDSTYFDGSGAYPADTHYTYAWTGSAHASSATRTRTDSRAIDLLQQEPGETDWDFLDPLIKAADLRLWCDEQRRWYLTTAEHEVDGTVTVSEGFNATSGSDTRDLRSTNADGSPVAFTGVVVAYTGGSTTVYDSAGTNRKVWRFDIDRPYPGPGRAASLLAQAEGRGRTQELTALMDITATPRQHLVTTLPGVPTQLGRVARVTFLFDSESEQHGLMTIGSRGLTETPANAWFFALGTWSAATGTWAAATGTN